MKGNLPEICIRQKNGIAVVSSIDVAEKFGKQHNHVLRSIRAIIEASSKDGQSNFGQSNFAESSYLNDQHKRQPMFNMTRAGFSILAMGFTGKKALEWKIKYEDAFSKMERALSARTEPHWLTDRREGKLSRREETDAVADFIEYAKAQGSTRANFYYKHFTSATYRALFIVADRFPGSFRDLLNTKQLRRLAVAEDLVTEVIREGMANGLFYKDVFLSAKAHLEKYADSVGVSTVVSPAVMLPGICRLQIEARA